MITYENQYIFQNQLKDKKLSKKNAIIWHFLKC